MTTAELKATDPSRRAHLGTIHRLADDLGLDYEGDRSAYEAILESMTGKRSSALMSYHERQRVIGTLAGKLHVATAPTTPVSDEEALDALG